MQKKIEIEDILEERVDMCVEGVKDMLLEYLEENKPSDIPSLHGDLDYNGHVNELIDGCVPIYNKELDDTWYLHKDVLIEAYENAGIGNDPSEKNGAVAIYCYLQDKVSEWYHENVQEIFDDFVKKLEEEEEAAAAESENEEQ